MRTRVLNTTLDELEHVDATALSDDELHELVLAEQRLVSQFAAVRARHVAEWDARRVWDSDGSKASWARLARECSLSAGTAKVEVRRAKKLRSMPATAAAFGDGKLSVDQVDLLTTAVQRDIVTVFERDEQLLVDQLAALSCAHAKRCVDYWVEPPSMRSARTGPVPTPTAES